MRSALDAGINCFDTAEAYGEGILRAGARGRPANSRTPAMPTDHDQEYCVSIRNPLAGGPATSGSSVVADAGIVATTSAGQRACLMASCGPYGPRCYWLYGGDGQFADVRVEALNGRIAPMAVAQSAWFIAR